jgi:hypothetical protein
MRAVAKVENKIVITGADNASDAINKARKSVLGLERTTKRAGASSKKFGKDFAEAGDQAAGRAGKLSTALSSLGDFAGKSEGSFRQASEAAGAFDDVLTLLPGPIGLGAAAIAGLTTVTYLQIQATQQAEEKLRQAFGGRTLADIRALRSQFDLTAEASVALGNALIDSGKSAAEVEDELRAVVNRAEAVGEDGSAAVKRFAGELVKGVSAADKLQNKLRILGSQIKSLNLETLSAGTSMAAFGAATEKEATQQLGKLSQDLSKATQRLKDLRAGHTGAAAEADKQVGVMQRLTGFFNKNSSANHKLREAWHQQTRAIVAQRGEIGKIKDEIQRVSKIRERLAERIKANRKVDAQVEVEEAADERQRVKRWQAEQARAKTRARNSRGRAARRKREADATRNAAFGLRQAIAGQRAILEYQRQDLDTEALVARARVATAKSTKAKIEAERELIAVATRRQILEVNNTKIDPEDKTARIQAIEELARIQLAARIKAIDDSNAAIAQKKRDDRKREQEKEKQELISSLSIVGTAAGDVGGKFGAAAASAVASTGEIAKSWKGLAGSSPDVITAIGGVAAATVDGERAKHAILAISETGAALAAAGLGDYKSAALHGAAAVVYGASAAGIVGGDSGSTAAGGGGAFADQAASTQAAGGSGGGGAGVTVINNFNQPLATQQQIGRASLNAIRSAGRTGHAQSAGV